MAEEWPGLDAPSAAPGPPPAPPQDWPGLDSEPMAMEVSAKQKPGEWPGLDPVQPSAPAPVGAAQTLPGEVPHGESGAVATFGAEAAKAAIGLPAEALKGLGVGVGQLSDQPIEQGSMYQMGKKLQHYADTWGATEESLKAHPIAGGAGSVVGGVAGALPALGAAGLAAPAVGVGAGAGILGAGAGLFAASAAGNTFNAALLKGADENTASQAAGLSALVGGALGVVPLGVVLAPVRAYAPTLTGWAAWTLEKALRSGIVFTGVGEAQEFLGRQIAQNFYDPQAGYSPDVSRLLGSFIGGGIIGTVTPQMLHNERTRPLTDTTVLQSQQDQKPKTTPAIARAEAEALRTAGGAPPLVNEALSEAAGIATEPKTPRFTLYHGSGAEFDRIDPTKLGTGEGNAAFGHAEFYGGENPLTGRDYQNRMGGYFYGREPYDGTNPAHKAAMLLEINGSREQAIRAAEEAVAADTTRGESPARAINNAAAEVLRSEAPLEPLEHRGFFYTAEIRRPKEQFLDWDRSLGEQSPYVQLRVGRALQEVGVDTAGMFQAPGRALYSSLSRVLGSDAAASEVLSKHGIAGNRYLDALSRGLPPPTMPVEGGSIVEQKGGRFTILDQYNAKITDAATRADAEAMLRGEKPIGEVPRSYNAAVFKAHDVEITHRNGVPLKPEEQRAIQNVQFGVPVENSHGRAIVNGHELENIGTDELRTFAPPAGGEPGVPVGRNGYDINRSAMEAGGVKDFPPTPVTEASAPLRNVVKGLYPDGKVPPGLHAAAAGVDHFWNTVKWLWDLRALTDANPHIEPLVRYTSEQDTMKLFATQWQVKAEETLRTAWKLREGMKQNLYKFINDYINLRYLSVEERKAGVIRLPTNVEMAKLFKLHGVDDQAQKVFHRMDADFREFVGEMFGVMRRSALDLPGKEQKRALDGITAQEKALFDRPYFPATRYGLFTISTRGPDGPRYYRYETKREQDKALRHMRAQAKPGDEFTPGKLPQSSLPFSGLPKQMLEVIEKQFVPHSKDAGELRAALKQMEFEMNPVRGFGMKFGRGAPVPGYSTEFFRNYANFFFHGSSYLARMKHVDGLKGALKDLRDSSFHAPDRVKRAEIADFVEQHYQKMLDPRGDWAKTRAFMFHMVLGFRPASAATNLTQTFISTYPHLAAQFGDLGAIRSMTKASTNIQNFYRRSTIIGMTDPQMRAMAELMQAGRIRGALAPEMAALSEGRGLLGGYGLNRAQTALTHFLKLSSAMFEGTEQMNRRVAGMATYDLAMRNPENKFVKQAITQDAQFYAELISGSRTGHRFPPNEAAAIVAAKAMIDRTQFQYSKEYRPAYLSGPIGSTVGLFKLFTHRMLWNMYNYPSAAMRQLLIMGFLGGLMGIPGFQDLNGILKAIGVNVFGKDWDLEDEARRFAVDVLGMKGGKGILDDPFTIVKGFASRGYGIPALADFLGEWAGVGKIPIPELDRTAAISLNNILPLDFGVLFGAGASKDPAKAFGDAVSKGMGPVGSYGYNTYKAMMNIREEWDTLRRWEKVAPTFLANMSHAARVYVKGAEVSQSGAKVIRFDPHDTEHMMEAIAMGLGYQPFRLTKEWSRIRAEAEAKAFWDVRREMLLNQYWAAVQARDRDDQKRVIGSIQNFNRQIQGTDARGKVITPEVLDQSVERRFTAKSKQEAGIPASEGDVPLVRGIRRLFPGAEVDQRRVR